MMTSIAGRVKQTTARPIARAKRRKSYLLLFLAGFLPALLIVLTQSTYVPKVEAISTTVVISQVYAGGNDASGTYRCDYIEFYNRGTTSVNLGTYSFQQAAATGTSWNRKNLSGTLAPGQYYLLQLACNPVAPGLDITNEDDSSSISLAETGAKLALVSNQTTITSGTSCPLTGFGVLDFVGYGTADCSETTPKAIVNANNNAIFRLGGGNIDTDNNSTDFVEGTPNPRSTTSQAASITFDNAQASCIFNSLGVATSFSWTHTITSTAGSRILVVGVSTFASAGTPGALNVTYGGVALTRVGTITNTDTSVEIWRLLDAQIATRASDTITVTLGVGVTQYAVGGSASFSGVNQVIPHRNFIGNTGNTGATSANDPNVTVPSANRELVIDTVATTFSSTNLLTVGTSQAELWNGKSDSDCNGDTGEPDLTLNSIGAGSLEAGAAPSVPMTWDASANNANWAIGAISLIPLAPTAVELTSFEALQGEGGTLLQWETGFEVDNLGFNLYREVKGKRSRVNPSIIGGSALLVGQGTSLTAGRSYTWMDTKGSADAQYYLEEIDLDGTRNVHGPRSAVKGDAKGASTKQRALLLSQMSEAGNSAAQSVFMGQAIQSPIICEGCVGNPNPPKMQKILANGAAAKISISKSGWYRVGWPELAAAGLDSTPKASNLQLYANGVEQAIRVSRESGQMGAGDYIEFYGTGLDRASTDTQVYWLIVGTRAGRRIPFHKLNTSSNLSALTSTTNMSVSPSNSSGGSPVSGNQSVGPRNTIWGVPLFIILPKREESVSPVNSTRAETPGAIAAKPEVITQTPAQEKRRTRKLRSKRRPGQAAREVRHHAHAMAPASQSFPYTLERKERTLYFSSLQNGGVENFFGPIVYNTPVTQALNVQHLHSPGPDAVLEIALQGATTAAHQVKVIFNDVEIGTLNYLSQARHVASLSISNSLLREGDNSLKLVTTDGESDVSLLDYVRLTYPHLYVADKDSLRFTMSQADRVSISGFTNSNVRVLDITDTESVEEIQPEITAQGGTFSAAISVQGSVAGREVRTMLAFVDRGGARPDAISANQPSNWNASKQSANFVIITHPDFRNAVAPLAELRRKQGMTVAVVNVDDLYDEFSYGAHDPQAIRDFLSSAKSSWRKSPRYVLLVGDASFDPRNYLGLGKTDYLPTHLVDTAYMETASDDWLADFNGDGVPDMAVGRLPVRTAAQAQAIISKIVGYTQAGAPQTALFVADKRGSDGYDFEAASHDAQTLLPSSISVQTINRGDQAVDSVRSQIIQGINQSPLLVNYMGHGTIGAWTGAGLFGTADAASLTNASHPSLFVMMTCLNGFYHDPSQDSLAEALLYAEQGGAVAVWASSGLTEPTGQALMNKGLMSNLFANEQSRIGDILIKAKGSTSDRDIRTTWIFFGDPTMTMR